MSYNRDKAMRNFILGKRIYLRGLRESELSSDGPYFGWLNDLSLDYYTERSYFPNTEEKMNAFYEVAQRQDKVMLLGIFDNKTNKHIGNITLSDINYLHQRAFIAYMLGDKSFEGQGITTDACLMLMYYGFNKLNFQRIDGGVADIHPASRRVCEKVGLFVEGEQRNYFMRNGQWYNRLVVGALRSQWMDEFGERARSCFEKLPC